MKILLLLLVGLGCISALPMLVAEDQDAVLNSHQQAANELLILTGAEKNGKIMADAVWQSMLPGLNQDGSASEAMMDDLREAVGEWTEQVLSWENMGPPMIALYTETFTEDELDELIAFYKTPIGARSLEKLPELMQKGALIGQQLAANKQDQLQRAVVEVIEKYQAE